MNKNILRNISSKFTKPCNKNSRNNINNVKKSEMKEDRDAGYYESYVYNFGKHYAPETDNKKETET